MHPGNRRYRDIIDQNLDRYKAAENKNEKSNIVIEIVEEVRTDAAAGFIRFCDDEQLWFEIGDDASREKVGQTLRETLTQRDPDKRAKKRIKRAINKAKRAAAREALDLEPIDVTQCDDFPGAARQPTVMPLPLTASRAWSATQTLQNTTEALLAATSASPHDVGSSMLCPPNRRASRIQGDGITDFEPLSFNQQASQFSNLQRGLSMGNIGMGRLPLTAASQASQLNFQGLTQSMAAQSLQQQMVAQNYARSQSLLALMASKEFSESGVVPPTLNAMTAAARAELLSRSQNNGGHSSKESNVEKRLFEFCCGLSAAA